MRALQPARHQRVEQASQTIGCSPGGCPGELPMSPELVFFLIVAVAVLMFALGELTRHK